MADFAIPVAHIRGFEYKVLCGWEWSDPNLVLWLKHAGVPNFIKIFQNSDP